MSITLHHLLRTLFNVELQWRNWLAHGTYSQYSRLMSNAGVASSILAWSNTFLCRRAFWLTLLVRIGRCTYDVPTLFVHVRKCTIFYDCFRPCIHTVRYTWPAADFVFTFRRGYIGSMYSTCKYCTCMEIWTRP